MKYGLPRIAGSNGIRLYVIRNEEGIADCVIGQRREVLMALSRTIETCGRERNAFHFLGLPVQKKIKRADARIRKM